MSDSWQDRTDNSSPIRPCCPTAGPTTCASRSTAGRIAASRRSAARAAGDERHAILVPAMPNLHSHAFQRGMAGLAETRGPGDDSFWSWREVMYRFALTMTPDQVEAVAAQLYVEMLEAGFARVGEFHYLHHDTDGAALCQHRRDGRAHRRGSGRDRHRPDAAAGLLCPFGLRRRGAATRASGASSTIIDRFARLLEAAVQQRSGLAGRRRRRRAAQPARRDAGRACAPSWRWPATGRSTSMSPSRRRKSRTASPGPARGRSNGCSPMRRSTTAGA